VGRYADDHLLDDLVALAAADPGDMLRATADAGAQVRRALAATSPAALAAVAVEGRPRAVVVAGMGGSGISGDLLGAVCGTGCPVSISTVRGYVLPGWVGPLDLVIAVSCSGRTEETLTVAAEAAKRGTRLVGVGTVGSPLHDLVLGTPGAVFLGVDAGELMPRASLWLLSTPLLRLADALGLADIPVSVLERAADVLDERSVECGPASAFADNPAKLLGVQLAASLPMVWGTSPIGAVAAYRMACQLNENAKMAVVHGAVPEATHNQVVALDGQLVTADADIFRDPIEDGAGPARLRLVLLRDPAEHPQDARRADLTREIAERRDVPVDVVHAPEGHAVVRLAALVGLVDWASVYAAVAGGVDPTPIGPINELKDRLS
jgi:glucose/mannose-6-phosphate isomerase